MPTYEYECKSCHHRFEKLQPITAKPSTPCPRCKKSSKRLFSRGGGIIFKGSGFYATDHRSAGYKDKARCDSKTPPSTPSAGGCGKPSCPKD